MGELFSPVYMAHQDCKQSSANYFIAFRAAAAG